MRRIDLAAASACAAIGVLISSLPNLLWWPKLGSPIWVATYDELCCYLPPASKAFHNHPFYLSDHALLTGGAVTYDWLQLIPGVLAAKALGLGPMGIILAWRVFAGATIGLGWYLLIRRFVDRPWIAACLASVLLSDIGSYTAFLFFKQVGACARLAAGASTSAAFPPFDLHNLHNEWRLMTPGLSLGYLLAHLWLLERAKSDPTPARLAWSGVGFGVIFHVYFYFWTAAALGLALAFLLDAPRRKAYLHTGWIGALIGLPKILSGMRLKADNAPEWYFRTEKFFPIPRLSEIVIPKLGLILALAALVWVWRRRRDLLSLWLFAASGLALLNEQVITGFPLDNFHWTYVWGPALSLITLLLVAGALKDRLIWPRPAALVFASCIAAHLGAGLWLRAVEGLHSPQGIRLSDIYRKYGSQRLGPAAAPLAAGAVAAGDGDFVDFAVVLENARPLYSYSIAVSPSIGNPEWNERHAVNSCLLGLDRTAFEAKLRRLDYPAADWGPWARDPAKNEERIRETLGFYDSAAADPAAAAARFQVGYVALPSGQAPPAYLRSGWSRLQDGPSWQLWERGG